MSVQGLARGCDGEPGGEGCSAELGSSSTRCEDGTNGDVFNEAGVDFGAFDEGLEGASEEVGGLGVFETTLSTLGEGSAKGACYDDLPIVSAVLLITS